MKINSISSYDKIHHSRFDNSKSVPFKGFLRLSSQKIVNGMSDDIISYLRITDKKFQNEIYSKIAKLPKNQQQNRLKFLTVLSEKASYMALEGKEVNEKVIISMFERIKKPKYSHIRAIKEYGLEKGSQLIDLMEENKSADLVKNLFMINNKLPIDQKIPYEIINKFANSEQKYEILKAYQKLKSYIIINSKDENLVENIIKILNKKDFNTNRYDKILEVKQLVKKLNILEDSDVDEIVQNYSSYGVQLLEKYNKAVFKPSTEQKITKELKNNSSKEILDMYKTTTKNNFNARNALLNNVERIDWQWAKSQYNDQIINQLFNMMDNNKNIAKFVMNISQYQVMTPNRILQLLKLNPNKNLVKELNNNLKVADIIFKNNTIKIKETQIFENLVNELNANITNRFYKPQRYLELRKDNDKWLVANSYFSGIKLKIRNLKEKIENKFFVSSEVRKFPPFKIPKDEIMPKLESEIKVYPSFEYNNQKLLSQNASQNPLPDINTILHGNLPETKELITKNVLSKFKFNNQLLLPPATKKSILLENGTKIKVTTDKEMKKLVLQKEANVLLKKYLNKKQLEKQALIYQENATKYKLNVLSEMFNSLNYSRNIKQATGTKSNVTTKDVLQLFKIMNYKNKAVIKALLKQKNVKGERVFSVKDVLKIMKDTRIEQMMNAKNASGKKEYKPREIAIFADILF